MRPLLTFAVLAALAIEVGLPADEVHSVLESDRYTDAVREDERTAAQLGISAVPFFVVDRRLAIREALAGRGGGDVVVVAGKGHESGQTAGGVTVPFDDRVVAREELGRLGFPGGAGCG